MAESDGGLRSLIRRHLGGADFVVDTVEMGLRGYGFPDVSYAFPGGEGWVENKRAAHWRVAIRPAQVGWLTRRAELGCRVWIAVRRADDELWLLPGGAARALKREGLRGLHVQATLVTAGGPSWWDWPRVRSLLTGPAPTLDPEWCRARAST